MSLRTGTRPRASLAEPVRWSSDDLLLELQSTLRAVADVDLRYEIAHEGLEECSGSASAKHRRLVELETQHRLELEPYAHKLDQLQRRIRSLMSSPL
jgi:hypothetical protein